MNKTAIVTGCAGFIGNNLLLKLLSNGWYVYGIDKIDTVSSTDEYVSYYNNYKNQFTFIAEDVLKQTWLPTADVIFNLAADSHVDKSIIDSSSFVRNNIETVRHLLQLIEKRVAISVDPPLFFHFSTDEVYGDLEVGSFNESSPLNPSNPYSAAKAGADLLLSSWARTYGLNYIIVRPSNNFGDFQYHEKLIPLAVKKLQANKKIHLHNRGKPVRTWTHVKDTIDAVLLLYEKGERNRIYNISSGFEQPNLETAKKVINCFYMGKPNVNIPDFQTHLDFSYERPGQDVRYAINCMPLNELGWEPKKHFDTSIASVVDFYRNRFIW